MFYDLPIALSILAASSQIDNLDSDTVDNSCFIGELSLDGGIKPVRGIISMAEQCRKYNKRYFFVPEANANQAACIESIKIVKCKNLNQVLKQISDTKILNKRFPLLKDIKDPDSKK